MKNITIITEQISEKALAAALPADGIASVTISSDGSARRDLTAADHHVFGNPNRFNPAYRVELFVEDDAVDTVFDGISFAYGAGLFSNAQAWVNVPVLTLSA